MAKRNNKNKKVTGPQGWYYMSKDELTVSELAASLDAEKYDIEIWKVAGILEIGIEEKVSIDIEECELDLRDEYSNQFLAENEVKSLFYVSFKLEEMDKCIPVLKNMLKVLGGMLCGDTDDFSPIYP